MKRLRQFASACVLACVLLACAPVVRAAETPAEHAASVAAQKELDAAPVHGNLPHYALGPAELAKAQHISHVRVVLHIVRLAWALFGFVIFLWWGLAAWMRDKALAAGAGLRERGKRGRAFWQECLVFSSLYVVFDALLSLPLSAYSHSLNVRWGLSVQSWGSWFGDVGKNFVLSFGAILFFALLMWLVRSLPRTWWFAMWCVSAPMSLVVAYALPIYIDPLFNKFEPLDKTQPQLVDQLERVVARGHMDIPRDRMFLMKASAKVTTMNAYVTGFGASKRVVVWDTSLAKGTQDEVLFIFGHESGHYVLGHVTRGILMGTGGLLLALWLGYLFVNWSIARFGRQWRIPGQTDWAALLVLLFAFTIFSTVSEPLSNGISRAQEHAADVYGQEAVHGIVADPRAAGVGTFYVLGAASSDEPNPPRWVEIWMDNHPATGRRAAFAATYDPWAPGMTPKYFPAEEQK